MIQREAVDFNATKQEPYITKSDITTNVKTSKASSSSTTTSSWSRLKDPRIVRVSRAFGGKDRHSKVCTVRGLRDRRVRLSVPTAIQLYDLQDRLGLNQPSKVVDWLLGAAKNEIDELPPLQIPTGAFTHYNLHPMIMNNSSQELITSSQNDQEGRQQFVLDQNQISSNVDFLGRQNPPPPPPSSSLSNLLMNMSSMPNYNPFLRWDPSSLTLSHPPRSNGLILGSSQPEDSHNFGLVPLHSTLSSSVPPPHQVLLYQGMSTQSYFPSPNTGFDPKDLNFVPNSSSRVEEESSASQSLRPFHFSMSTAELLPSQNNDANDQQNKLVHHNFRLG